jgi:membrane protease YdiL (CAAX protease family)
MKVDKTQAIKNATGYFVYLFLVWGFYRFLFDLPDITEEVIIKPLIWLLPIVYLLKKEGAGVESVGIKAGGIFSSLYFVIFLGAIFALTGAAAHYIKYNGIEFEAFIGNENLVDAILLSFVTAVSEEIAFRGYIYSRLSHGLTGEWAAHIVTAALWVMIHLPIVIIGFKLGVGAVLAYSLLMFVYSIGASFLVRKTGNIFSTIALHVLWQWPIVLFR